MSCLREYVEIYGTAINRIDRDNMSAILCDIYEELNPNTIGRIMAYLTIVYKVTQEFPKKL